MKGNFLMGLNFVFVKLYPMRPGATLISSLLVNTGIVLIMAPAILQFCAQAFGEYASNSDIFDIFGVQVRGNTSAILSPTSMVRVIQCFCFWLLSALAHSPSRSIYLSTLRLVT